MEAVRAARQRKGLSQREFALRAGLSFRGYQLMESPDHNARIASLEKIAAVLGLPLSGARHVLSEFLSLPPESIGAAALRILADGPDSLTVHLFDFVDAFRSAPSLDLVRTPPPSLDAGRLDAVLAGTVEALCVEAELLVPLWCGTVPALREPWFVSGVENLKASALLESPVPFRQRNVFVLGNFLDRA